MFVGTIKCLLLHYLLGAAVQRGVIPQMKGDAKCSGRRILPSSWPHPPPTLHLVLLEQTCLAGTGMEAVAIALLSKSAAVSEEMILR